MQPRNLVVLHRVALMRVSSDQLVGKGTNNMRRECMSGYLRLPLTLFEEMFAVPLLCVGVFHSGYGHDVDDTFMCWNCRASVFTPIFGEGTKCLLARCARAFKVLIVPLGLPFNLRVFARGSLRLWSSRIIEYPAFWGCWLGCP